MGLRPGNGVLVPSMTFAATAEIVRYLGGVPLLVDSDSATLNMDPAALDCTVADLRAGRLPASIPTDTPVVGVIPVHVGGLMMDMDMVQLAARRLSSWVIEDAAHAFPSAWRTAADTPWIRCGQQTAAVTCFSFYANKTITTGEGRGESPLRSVASRSG
jgi:perosamine synthetase